MKNFHADAEKFRKFRAQAKKIRAGMKNFCDGNALLGTRVTPLKVRGSGRKLKFTSANFARENFPRRVCWAKSAPGGPQPVQKSREKKWCRPHCSQWRLTSTVFTVT